MADLQLERENLEDKKVVRFLPVIIINVYNFYFYVAGYVAKLFFGWKNNNLIFRNVYVFKHK